jgi:hypothetical protein
MKHPLRALAVDSLALLLAFACALALSHLSFLLLTHVYRHPGLLFLSLAFVVAPTACAYAATAALARRWQDGARRLMGRPRA